MPLALRQRLDHLAQGRFVEHGVNVLAVGLPGTGNTQALCDLGYLPRGTEESGVLFTLIAERYERRSMGITSNLVFSQWEHIFANPMATAAAIDRVVHHSVILEFDVPSYRTGVAQQRGNEQEVNRQE